MTKRELTLEEQLRGELPLTQFGRACKKLEIEIIPASSPQAKGRVESKHGVYQDRWVKELRLGGISDIEAANRYLPAFADKLNAKFSKEPRSSADYHKPLPEGLDLRSVFCLEETRTVGNDWVVRYKSRFLQILPQSNLPPAKNKVTVQEHLDGSLHLVYRGKEVVFSQALVRQTSPQPPSPKTTLPQPRKAQVPSPYHPWRRFNPSYLAKRKTVAL